MNRCLLVAGVAAALGLSMSASAQQLEWVNGQGDASGYWQPAQYRIENGLLARVDATGGAAPRVRPPALSYEQLAQESESDSRLDPSQPHYRVDHRKLVLENPVAAAPRERVTMGSVERLYRDFATG